MMVSGVQSSRRGVADITYPMRDKKKQRGKRIEDFAVGGGLIDNGTKAGIIKQFRRIWEAGNRYNGDITGYKYLLAWSRNELDPDDPASIGKARDMGVRIMEQMCPNRQWILVIQKDGRSGLIHAHGFANALHNDLTPAVRRETYWGALRTVADKTLGQFGIEIDRGENHKVKEDKLSTKRKSAKEKYGFSWTEYLEQQIQKAIDMTTRKSEFESNLAKCGVSVNRKFRNGWTYELAECPVKEYVGKRARYDKFKSDFSNKAINEAIDANYKKERAAQQAAAKQAEETERNIAARKAAEKAQEDVKEKDFDVTQTGEYKFMEKMFGPLNEPKKKRPLPSVAEHVPENGEPSLDELRRRNKQLGE